MKNFDVAFCASGHLQWIIIRVAKSETKQTKQSQKSTLGEKCPYSEFFWSVFSLIRTECGETRSISLYSVPMLENKDQEKSKYGYFSPSDIWDPIKPL